MGDPGIDLGRIYSLSQSSGGQIHHGQGWKYASPGRRDLRAKVWQRAWRPLPLREPEEKAWGSRGGRSRGHPERLTPTVPRMPDTLFLHVRETCLHRLSCRLKL